MKKKSPAPQGLRNTETKVKLAEPWSYLYTPHYRPAIASFRCRRATYFSYKEVVRVFEKHFVISS